jgi:methylphosphotriester-DNA--protein-cysteine methyltransferase
MLMAKPNQSVTETALDVGFSDTGSSTAAFRRLAGRDADRLSAERHVIGASSRRSSAGSVISKSSNQ